MPLIDFSTLDKPKGEYPLFNQDFPSPVKGLVVERMPKTPIDKELVKVTVYLEDGTWLLDNQAMMDFGEVLEVAEDGVWLIIPLSFVQELQGLNG